MRKIERVNQSSLYCWAGLVGWHYTAVNERRPRMEPFARYFRSGGCQDDAEQDGACWCGKFATPAWLADLPVAIPLESAA